MYGLKASAVAMQQMVLVKFRKEKKKYENNRDYQKN